MAAYLATMMMIHLLSIQNRCCAHSFSAEYDRMKEPQEKYRKEGGQLYGYRPQETRSL